MVKRAKLPQAADGSIDIAAWAARMAASHPGLAASQLVRIASKLSEEGLRFGLELAELLLALGMDQASVCCGLVYRDVRTERLPPAELEGLVGDKAAALVLPVVQMANTSVLEISNSNLHDAEQESQVENVKRMLVSMIDDPRVAVVKLAERVVALRWAKDYPEARRQRIADEALQVFAPLAGRLGIGQLKWELEDFALRYREEKTYKDIARRLRSTRAERERQVNIIVERLHELLVKQGIHAAIHGRAKHIYSILRKMQRKQVPFEQVYDVRAVRVIVSSIAECYAVLGLIHTTWPHLPSEFDDYIAHPKENGYRSIHTAVTLDDGQMIEIQIRTEAMHAEAELGVCAHWTYKGEADDSDSFKLKTDWLRQVIEWHEELEGTERLTTLLQHRASDERIYVSTPKGHVLDLPHQATLLDFAYRVHTDVGHRCIGGRVDGVVQPIYQPLATSQQVTIETDAAATPQREWLERCFGFATTDRARAKLVSYFRSLPQAEKETIGRALLADALYVLGLEPGGEAISAVLKHFEQRQESLLFAQLGSGELGLFEVVEAFIMRSSSQQQLMLPGVYGEERQQAVRLFIRGRNRDGLLNELTQVVSSLRLPLSEANGRLSKDGQDAIIEFETHVQHWEETLKLQSRLRYIRDVDQIGPWSRASHAARSD